MSLDSCPLDRGIHWESRLEIPDTCQSNCGKLWQEAASGPSAIDVFDPGCMEACDIEYDDQSLQRLGVGSERVYTVLNICMNHGIEMFAEEYAFECPND